MRHREATDFTPAVLAAWHQVVGEITARMGSPRFEHGPIWMEREYGMARWMGAVWFLPVDGKLINHNIAVGEFGRGPVGAAPAVPRSWRLEAGRHAGAVKHAAFVVTDPPLGGMLRTLAGYVDLLERT